jgi:hypothetical protein
MNLTTRLDDKHVLHVYSKHKSDPFNGRVIKQGYSCRKFLFYVEPQYNIEKMKFDARVLLSE